MKEFLEKLLRGERLHEDESYNLMSLFADESTDETYLTAAVSAIETRGIRTDELAGFVRFVSEKTSPVSSYIQSVSKEAYEISGTGLDFGVFNVPLLSSLLVASDGVKVIKQSGGDFENTDSNDLYDLLGLNVAKLTPDISDQMLRRFNFTVLYTPNYRQKIAKLGQLSKKLGVKTFLNAVNLLTNPAKPGSVMFGGSSYRLAEALSRGSFKIGGFERALIVSSVDFFDFTSVCAPTKTFLQDQNGFKGERFIKFTNLGFAEGFESEQLFVNSHGDFERLLGEVLSADMSKAAPNAVVYNAVMAFSNGILEQDKTKFAHFSEKLNSGALSSLINELKKFIRDNNLN
jgi:anthranilate phosphoribosyltransferase